MIENENYVSNKKREKKNKKINIILKDALEKTKIYGNEIKNVKYPFSRKHFESFCKKTGTTIKSDDACIKYFQKEYPNIIKNAEPFSKISYAFYSKEQVYAIRGASVTNIKKHTTIKKVCVWFQKLT
jgi:hypothetical protein